jgi:hypothetical protein
MANSAAIYRYTIPYLNVTNLSINTNGYFLASNIVNLKFIQRRLDPMSSANETRDVYGYFDNLNVYKFVGTASNNTISAVSQIALPSIGIFIETNSMIDVGKYQLAVYSAANCNSTAGVTNITSSSAWFYTFNTSTWSCMGLGNQPTVQEAAWTTPL